MSTLSRVSMDRLALKRLVLVRHGETTGESSIRFHGSTDVGLSELGIRQARRAGQRIPGEVYELVVASPLSRAWRTALIALPRHPIQLEADFREIDFGRWEGLTLEEIELLDPDLYQDWQSRTATFDFPFPDGERRSHFRARVERGLERVLAAPVSSAVIVAHKGIVRTVVEALTREALEQPHPELGEVLQLSQVTGDRYVLGPRSSNPRACSALGIAPLS
jgi:broad specificity phosphatase PhoE